ncbi:hypothetical protein GCM10009678_40110 [Actinomadura kijaniata]|uniref:Integral membrane protein n=1 Tax=Actinomadura namibiensis TaxID=182080 RepID=A0A7W3LUJ3_ACTNM|nr:hypothetical protein [Actinomadura namibiensis]MBA8954467.1 hypothetical protein [Actinomadura namibiensis]
MTSATESGQSTAETSPPTSSPPTARDRFGDLARDWPYWLLCALVLAWAVAVVLRHLWGGDWPLHVATVRSFAADLTDPPDPMTGERAPSPYLSPYPFALAVLARLTGLSAPGVLEIAGVVNVALTLAGVRAFARAVSTRWQTAFLGVLFVFLLWGTTPLLWSGFMEFRSLSANLGYPSTFAFTLMLFVWAVFLKRRDTLGVPGFLGLGALFGLILLVHPFTAVGTALGLLGFALVGFRRWLTGGGLLRVAAAGAAAVAVILVWPYSDVADLFRNPESFSQIHERLVTDALGWYGLALLGLPALWLDRRRRGGPELLALWAVASLFVLAGVVFGRYEFARAMPVVVLPLQFALARRLGDPPPPGERAAWARPVQVVLAVASAAALCVGLYSVRGGVVRALPPAVMPQEEQRGSWDVPVLYPMQSYFAVAHVRPGETVLASRIWGRKALLLAGTRTVPTPWPYPYGSDWRRRQADGDAFFADSTPPQERLRIADRYRARCAVGSVNIAKPGALPGFRLVARHGTERMLCR